MQTATRTLTKSGLAPREAMTCGRCKLLERAAAELLRALEAWRLGPSQEVAAWVRVAEMDLRKAVDDEQTI